MKGIVRPISRRPKASARPPEIPAPPAPPASARPRRRWHPQLQHCSSLFSLTLSLRRLNLFPDKPSHLSAAHRAAIFLLNIKRPVAAVQNGFDGTLNPISRFGLVQ